MEPWRQAAAPAPSQFHNAHALRIPVRSMRGAKLRVLNSPGCGVRGAGCEAGGRAFRPGATAKSDYHGEHEEHEGIIRALLHVLHELHGERSGGRAKAGGRAFRPGALALAPGRPASGRVTPDKSDHDGEHESDEGIIWLFFMCFMSFMVNALGRTCGVRGAGCGVRSARVRSATCGAGGRAFRPGATAEPEGPPSCEAMKEVTRLLLPCCFTNFMVIRSGTTCDVPGAMCGVRSAKCGVRCAAGRAFRPGATADLKVRPPAGGVRSHGGLRSTEVCGDRSTKSNLFVLRALRVSRLQRPSSVLHELHGERLGRRAGRHVRCAECESATCGAGGRAFRPGATADLKSDQHGGHERP